MMIKQFFRIAFVLLVCLELKAQSTFQPEKYSFFGEEVYVFPFRSNSSEAIPPCLLPLPDGKYIVRKKFSYKMVNYREVLITKDTNDVTCVFHLKNGKPNGEAIFFEEFVNPQRSKRQLKKIERKGNYIDGLETGVWYIANWPSPMLNNFEEGLQHGTSLYFDKKRFYRKYKRNPSKCKTYSISNYNKGIAVGWSYSYKSGKVISKSYKNDLGINDSMYRYFKNGKLKSVRGGMAEKKVGEASKWLFLSQYYANYGYGRRYGRSYVVNENGGNPSWKLSYREYDKKGNLVGYVKYKDENYLFDSIYNDNRKIYLNSINGYKPIDTANYKITEWKQYYRKSVSVTEKITENSEVIKDIRLFINNKGERDTTITFHPKINKGLWIPYITSIESSNDRKKTSYIIPAFDYSYYQYYYRKKDGTWSKGYNSSKIISMDTLNQKVSFLVERYLHTKFYLVDTLVFQGVYKQASYAENRRKLEEYRYDYNDIEQPDLPTVSHSLEEFMQEIDFNTGFTYGYYKYINDKKYHENKFMEYYKADLRDLNKKFKNVIKTNPVILFNNKPFTGTIVYGSSFSDKYNKKKNILYNYVSGCEGTTRSGIVNGKFDGTTEQINKKVKGTRDYESIVDTYSKLHNTDLYYKRFAYINGKLNGEIIMKGNFAKTKYMHDRPWWRNQYKVIGRKKLPMEGGMFVNDSLEGNYFICDARDGDIAIRAKFKNGAFVDSVMLYKNAALHQVIYFKDNLFTGQSKIFLFGGKVSKLIQYKKDTITGAQKVFQFDGSLRAEIVAEKGIAKEKRLFNEKGVLVEETKFLGDSNKVKTANDINDLSWVNFKMTTFQNQVEYSSYNSEYTVGKNEKHWFKNFGRFHAPYLTSKGNCKLYHQSGILAAEGNVRADTLYGDWKFYDVTGKLIHNINFTNQFVKSGLDSVFTYGKIEGFYSNGEKRCESYLLNYELSYDCFIKQDKIKLELLPSNNYDYFSKKQDCVNGSGYAKQYDENGMLQSEGKIVNHLNEGMWKFYDGNLKVNAMGRYMNGKKDGIWISGDLEGLSFVDNACYDFDDPNTSQKILEASKKLNFKIDKYKNGVLIDSSNF